MKSFSELLARAGVQVNGSHPTDIQVRSQDEAALMRHFRFSPLSLAAGESYMDGLFKVDRLDNFFTLALSAGLEKDVGIRTKLKEGIKRFFFRLNKEKARLFAEHHYNLGLDFYRAMLGPTMMYTCGYWRGTDNVDVAQQQKIALVNKKIRLEDGMSVLDIGCGYGGYGKETKKQFPNVRISGITNASDMAKISQDNYDHIVYGDFRDFQHTKYDAVVSLGMIEHIGPYNYRSLMESAYKSLKIGGTFLLHTIVGNKSTHTTDPFIDKYIFPGSVIPSHAQILKAAEDLFVLEDLHNFGPDYDRTLMAWYKNLVDNWMILSTVYDQRIFRMYEYYLLSCAASFRVRKNQLCQYLLVKHPSSEIRKTVR